MFKWYISKPDRMLKKVSHGFFPHLWSLNCVRRFYNSSVWVEAPQNLTGRLISLEKRGLENVYEKHPLKESRCKF